MHSEIFTCLFQSFLDKNPFLMRNTSNPNCINISPQTEKALYNKMLDKDIQYFNILKKELKDEKICYNINNIYCLIFNECMNINSDISQQKVICSLLKNYLSNIINEIDGQFLDALEDKYSNDGNCTKNQKYKSNKKELRITIKLLFLILVFMFNKYKMIVNNTFEGYNIKGINMKSLKTNLIREELFFLIILQQNLYWMNIIIEGLLTIFQKLKNNKFRMLINTDMEFNNLDDIFKVYCFECFLNLFNIVKKYSSIKLNDGATRFYDVLFNANLIPKDSINNSDNIFLPLNMSLIDSIIFKLFECFIYEFLYDIDSLWKYFDSLKLKENSDRDNYEILYGFGIYLCEFIKLITFIRNENISKVDFFNFYLFSYKLLTNFFSNLNIYLYDIYIKLSNEINSHHKIIQPDLNLNYLQNLSNSLKDMLFNFMISSYNNDTLKEIYSFNEILMNSIISHCFIKLIISIYSLLVNREPKNILSEVLSIFLDNINKYKIILPLKSHFYKELMTHNYLLLLDEFLITNENKLIFYFQEMLEYKEFNPKINSLINKFNEVLSCLFNHYNPVNFLYSNHIMFIINQILSKSGNIYPESNSNTSNIFLRYIYSDNNYLNYKDIPITDLNLHEKLNPNFSTNTKQNINYEKLNEICFDNWTYNKEFNTEVENIGFALDDYLDKNSIKLFNDIEINEYKFQNYGYKNYLVKNSNKKNYSIILVQNDGLIEKLGIDEKLNENILNIMENNQYTDKNVYKLIQEKVINPGNENIVTNNYFYVNIQYYDLKFEINFFEYQNKIKELLI